LIAAPAFAKTLELGCSLKEAEKPEIWFAGITGGDFDQSDYGKRGVLTVTAEVSGNGNTAKFSTVLNYKKNGNRLEVMTNWIEVASTVEEFKKHFGVFPTLTCTSP
jgi:hypothetical protein